MKPQTKLQSFVESLINIGIGAIVAFMSQRLIFPMFDIHVSVATDLYLTFYFTVISIVRSYFIRRFMNWKQQKGQCENNT